MSQHRNFGSRSISVQDLLVKAGFENVIEDPRIALVCLVVGVFLVVYIIPPESLINFFGPMICAGVLFVALDWLHQKWSTKQIEKGSLLKQRVQFNEGIDVLKRGDGKSLAARDGTSYRPLVKSSEPKNGVRFSDMMDSDGIDPVEEFLAGNYGGSVPQAPRQLRKRERPRLMYAGRRKGKAESTVK